MRRSILAMLMAMSLVGCGSGGGDAFDAIELELPATVTGELEIVIEEGPVGGDDLSAVNFGSIRTEDGEVLIEVWAKVIRLAGLSRNDLFEGLRVSATFDRDAVYSVDAAPTYRVATLEVVG